MIRPFSHYEYRRLRLLANCCSGNDVLDLGYAQLPNPYYRDIYRVGLDLVKPVVQHDNPREHTKYEEEIVGNVARIEDIFVGRTFDNIVAGELIEHIENPYEFLRSLLPILSPNGRLILSTPNPLSFPVIFFEVLRNKRFFYTEDHVHYFCPRWVERMLVFSGYQVQAVKAVGLSMPLITLPCPVSLSYQVIYVATPAAASLSCGAASP